MAKTKIPSGNEDTTSFKCRRCGFVCNTERDKIGSGSGVSLDATTINGTSLYDPTVVAGCPFCGSFNYKTWQR